MNKHAMNLQLFAEEGGAAPAAPAGGGAETGTAADSGTIAGEIRVGDTLGDGTQVTDAKVAAALNRQMNRHPELRKVYGQNQTQAGPAEQAQAAPQQGQPEQAGSVPNDLQARWEAAKKGEFKELFGNDVQKAIKDRFKNQADAAQQLTATNQELDKYKKVTGLLMQKAGMENFDEFSQMVEDDDSLYEEEAEKMGMPVEAYKNFKKLQDEHDAAIAREQKAQERERNMQHIAGLQQQAEEMKGMFPNFDLQAEMQNPEFFRLTAPGGISVKQAYLAIHGEELIPQLMGYGMQRAQQQMGQTLQAQRSRPAEGAMSAKNQAAAEPALNPASLQRGERNKIKEYVKKYGPISFDRRKT